MMKKIRSVVSIIVGVAIASLLYFIGEEVNLQLHPYPETLDVSDRETLRLYFNSQSRTIWIAAFFIWAVGSFVAGFIIKGICKSKNLSLPLIAGCLLTLIGTRNMFNLPHPVSFSVIAFFAFIPFVLFGFAVRKVKTKRRK